MSDTTFHLEESLTSLAKVNALRSQTADSDDEDLRSQLAQAERSAPFHTSMGLDHVELIRDFTATTREPFTTDEIVDRLTAASVMERILLTLDTRRKSVRPRGTENARFAIE